MLKLLTILTGTAWLLASAAPTATAAQKFTLNFAEDEPAAKPVKEKKKKKKDDADLPPATKTPTSGAIDQATYVIGPEDVLKISVWHENDISGTFDVRPDGMISMQLVNEIKAAGLTPTQLAADITGRLTKFINHPEVNVQILKVNSRKYIINGEVNHSGAFALTTPITFLEALSNAGGFRDFANTKKIYLLRGTKKITFNYKEVSKGKHMEQNILVENGDQIFVP